MESSTYFMRKTPEKTFRRILWRSFVTSCALAIIETYLLVLLLVGIYNTRIIFGNSAPGNPGVIPLDKILGTCLFVLSMRAVLGFIVLNFLIWVILAGSPVKLPMFVLALANGASVFVMYCVWNSRYGFLHELITIIPQANVFDLFNIYRGVLLCSLLAPFILPKLSWLPTVEPWILCSHKESLSEDGLSDAPSRPAA